MTALVRGKADKGLDGVCPGAEALGSQHSSPAPADINVSEIGFIG
jgi:hypothetical protein